MDDNLKSEILRSISLTGESEKPSFNPVIARDAVDKIVDKSKGLPRIRPRLVKEFKLIIAQPLALHILNPFEIRCCLCGKIITYPAWYYQERLAINWFHYFVCFSNTDVSKVTSRCFR